MDYIETALMVIIGFGLGRTWLNLREAKRVLLAKQEAINEAFADRLATIKALNSLRRNCFLTNERGHRVRYADASVAVRERAEGN